MKDQDIIAAIEWSHNVPLNARDKSGQPIARVQLAGNVDPLQPGDRPVGDAILFDPTNATKDDMARLKKKLTSRIVARYHKYNSPKAKAAPKPSVVRAAVREALVSDILAAMPDRRD